MSNATGRLRAESGVVEVPDSPDGHVLVSIITGATFRLNGSAAQLWRRATQDLPPGAWWTEDVSAHRAVEQLLNAGLLALEIGDDKGMDQ
jgi:hypothetical protein